MKLVKAADRVMLLFMLDATGSMAPHISGAKEQIQAIARSVVGSILTSN